MRFCLCDYISKETSGTYKRFFFCVCVCVCVRELNVSDTQGWRLQIQAEVACSSSENSNITGTQKDARF